jgi:hypothetical protein
MTNFRFLIILCLTFISISLISYTKSNNINDSKKEQVLVISSDPVNTFLDIKIKSSLLFQEDSLKNPLKVEVKIFNQKGIIVYSATKSVSDFDIFTGGLPEGNYTISCKICNRQLQRDFVVKH